MMTLLLCYLVTLLPCYHGICYVPLPPSFVPSWDSLWPIESITESLRYSQRAESCWDAKALKLNERWKRVHDICMFIRERSKIMWLGCVDFFWGRGVGIRFFYKCLGRASQYFLQYERKYWVAWKRFIQPLSSVYDAKEFDVAWNCVIQQVFRVTRRRGSISDGLSTQKAEWQGSHQRRAPGKHGDGFLWGCIIEVRRKPPPSYPGVVWEALQK